MKLKTWQKNVLSILAIIGISLVLLTVAFLFASLVQTVYRALVMPKADQSGSARMIADLWHLIFLALVVLISWLVLRTRLSDLLKAAFWTMPLAVVLAEIGVWLYPWPVLVYAVCAAVVAAVLLLLYNTKRSWLFFFSTAYVAAVMLFVMLSGMEI